VRTPSNEGMEPSNQSVLEESGPSGLGVFEPRCAAHAPFSVDIAR
jgi:hypothetical protein